MDLIAFALSIVTLTFCVMVLMDGIKGLRNKH